MSEDMTHSGFASLLAKLQKDVDDKVRARSLRNAVSELVTWGLILLPAFTGVTLLITWIGETGAAWLSFASAGLAGLAKNQRFGGNSAYLEKMAWEKIQRDGRELLTEFDQDRLTPEQQKDRIDRFKREINKQADSDVTRR